MARVPVACHVSARRPAAAVAGTVLFVTATLALFFVSRGKWSDAIIDSGREWIVPDALARGDLLYRDVVYWFGPVTPYFHALVFRVLGSSFLTLAAAGALAATAILAALFLALRRTAGAAQALLWTAVAVPALVFMPNAGGAICGMGFRIWHAAGFALAAVACAARPVRRRRRAAFFAGCLAGLSGLCRTEWGLAACAAVLLATWLSARAGARGPEALAGLAGWAAAFGGGIGLFLWLAGPQAVLRDGHVLLTGLPPETRQFLLSFSGILDWRSGLAQMAYSSAMWLGLVTAVELLALGAADASGRWRLARLAALLAAVAGAAALGGGSGAVLFSAAPAVCAAALVVGVWRAPRPRAALLAALGLLGLVLSYRRPFHIGDSAYVAPPLLFALACAGGLLSFSLARRRLPAVPRRRLRFALAAAGAILVAGAFLGRFAQYAADNRVPVRGTQGMLSALPEEAGRIEAAAAAVRTGTTDGEGLVCIPEGEVINFLSGRPNPIRHKLYIPGYLTRENESEIVAELTLRPPAAVVLWNRPMFEYGRGFLATEPDGPLARWLDANYEQKLVGASGSRSSVGFRRKAARP